MEEEDWSFEPDTNYARTFKAYPADDMLDKVVRATQDPEAGQSCWSKVVKEISFLDDARPLMLDGLYGVLAFDVGTVTDLTEDLLEHGEINAAEAIAARGILAFIEQLSNDGYELITLIDTGS